MTTGAAGRRRADPPADDEGRPGGQAALLALLNHIARELAEEYIERMEDAASSTIRIDNRRSEEECK
jgi:hypothetical protein